MESFQWRDGDGHLLKLGCLVVGTTRERERERESE